MGIRSERGGAQATAEASSGAAAASGQQPCRAAFLALACVQSFRRVLVGTPDALGEEHAARGAVAGRRLPLALGAMTMCVPNLSAHGTLPSGASVRTTLFHIFGFMCSSHC